MEELKKCRFCAEEIKKEAIICKYCGKGSKDIKNKSTAIFLAILFGGLGFHKFYLGRYISGIIYICFSWTFIPLIIGVLEGISYSSYSDKKWEEYTL